MSTTSVPTDFSDLYTGLLNRVRADTGASATVVQAKRYINTGLNDMHMGWSEHLPWAERTATLVTQPAYTTGTMAVTKGSTAVTGTSTAWTTANDFGVANVRATGFLVIEGRREIYAISSVDSTTTLTLATMFVGTTNATATYTYYENEYALASDFLRPVLNTSFDSVKEITLVGRNEFRKRYARIATTGKPTIATVIDQKFASDTTRVRYVVFNRGTDAAYHVPYVYITSNLAVSSAGAEQAFLSADADEPIVPQRYRYGIVLWALYNWYRDKEDDDRSRAVKAEYQQFMVRLLGDNEVGVAAKAKLKPVVGPYKRAAARPYNHGRGRRHTLGSAFDEIRD